MLWIFRCLIATLRLIFKQAKRWSYVGHDPFDGIVLPRRERAGQFYLSLENIRRIVEAAEEPYRTFYLLAAETGLRAGELCGLRWDDLDLDSGILRVCQSAWQGKLQTPKSANAVRSVWLSPEMVKDLKAYRLQWRPNPARLIFATRHGTPWNQGRLVKRQLHPLLERLGIRRCGLHAFRHANATLMDEHAVPLAVRKQRLGHSDARITLDNYTHAGGEDERLFAAKLGKILRPNAPKLGPEVITSSGQTFVN